MAFSSLTDTLIQIGKAVKREIFTTLKNNQDDLDSRVSAIETTSRVEVFNFSTTGSPNDYNLTMLEQIETYETFTELSLTEAKMTLVDSLSTSIGNIEMDILASTDGTTYTTIFSSKPTITASGTQSGSFTINPTYTTIDNGTFLKLAFDSIKDPQGSIQIQVYGEPS